MHPVVTPLREVVADACDRWSEKGALVRPGQVHDAVIRLDPGLFQEALDELIGNAVHQTPSGKPIEISARHEDGCEVIGVADRGPGIREDDTKPIFERFARADGDRKRGARLGLAIVQAIAKGARLVWAGVRDRPGGGAVVELRLPRQDPGQGPAMPGMATASASPQGTS